MIPQADGLILAAERSYEGGQLRADKLQVDVMLDRAQQGSAHRSQLAILGYEHRRPLRMRARMSR
jgi:hypothetical protein